jgi:hypothetical protein
MSTALEAFDPAGVAKRAAHLQLRDEALERASQAARTVSQMVVADEVSAARMVDMLAVIKDGTKIAKAKLEGVTRPFRAAEEEARMAFAPILAALRTAEENGKGSLWAYNSEKARREAAERERLLALAREAQAAQQAASPGAEVPMLEPPPPSPSAQTHGRRAMSYETTVLRCEVVDPKAIAAYDASLLKLDEVRAKALCRGMGDSAWATAPAHPLGGIVMFGVRFWKEKTVAIR